MEVTCNGWAFHAEKTDGPYLLIFGHICDRPDTFFLVIVQVKIRVMVVTLIHPCDAEQSVFCIIIPGVEPPTFALYCGFAMKSQ